jgi:hypothetical protein
MTRARTTLAARSKSGGAQAKKEQHGPVSMSFRVLYRLFSGRVLSHGRGPWDATFLHRAHRAPDSARWDKSQPTPHTAWGRAPGALRLLVRLAVPVLLYAAATLRYEAIPIAAAAVALVVWWLWRTQRHVKADNEISLLAEPLAHLLGWELDARLRWLRVPDDLSADDAEVVVQFPARFGAGEDDDGKPTDVQKKVNTLVKNRLPGEWESRWSHRELAVTFRHPYRLPSEVWARDLDDTEACGLVPIAVNKQGKTVTLDLANKTPHVVISASTGWGKTTTALVIAAHVLRYGARVIVLDPKRIGFSVLRGFPQVTIYTTADTMVVGIHEFMTEMEWRYQLIENYPEIEEEADKYFTRWVMFEDEKGSLTQQIKNWWQEQGNKGRPAPLSWQQIILWQARAACMDVVTMAQQANRAVFESSDNRDQYMARIAAGPQSGQAWSMLFPGERKRKLGKAKGRAVVGIGPSDPEDVQLAMMTKAEIRQAAEHGASLFDEAEAARRRNLEALTRGTEINKYVSLPANTSPNVPGHVPVPGTITESDENGSGEQSKPDLKLIKSDTDDAGQEATPAVTEDTALTTAEPAESAALDAAAESESEGAGPFPSINPWVRGNAAAAELLGMTKDNFIQHRKRAKKRIGLIPTETRGEDGLPQWRRLALLEWHRQLPRAGAKPTG